MTRRPRLTILTLALLAVFLQPQPSDGADPFENRANPPGYYFTLYPSYYHASKIMDKNGEATGADPEFTLCQNILRVTYFNRTTFKNTWAATVLVPAGRKEMFNDHSDGLGDITVGLGYWPVDIPEEKSWIGVGVYLDFPAGDYDSSRKANMGTNVWKFRPVLLFAKQFDKVNGELTLKYNMYSENEETGIREGNEFITEACLGYFVRQNIFIGGIFNGILGDNKTMNGNEIKDSGVRRYQAGPTVFWSPYLGFSLTLDLLYDLEVNNSVKGQLISGRLSWKL